MENASKALIIAGAILLAILIIGLGMLVFQQANNTVKQANLDQETVDAFNSKYDSYIGEKVKGTQVRTLLDRVRNNNLTADESTTYPIALDVLGTKIDATVGNTNAQAINTAKSNVKNGEVYKVEVEYDDAKGGLISKITISTAN